MYKLKIGINLEIGVSPFLNVKDFTILTQSGVKIFCEGLKLQNSPCEYIMNPFQRATHLIRTDKSMKKVVVA